MDENKHESCGLTETHNGASFEQLRENRKKEEVYFIYLFFAEEALRSFPSGTDILAQELAMSCGIAAACAPACAAAGRKSESSTSERFLSSCADASVWLACTEWVSAVWYPVSAPPSDVVSLFPGECCLHY